MKTKTSSLLKRLFGRGKPVETDAVERDALLYEALEPRILYSGTVPPDAANDDQPVQEAAPVEADQPEADGAVGAESAPVSAIQAAQQAAADLQQFVSEDLQISTQVSGGFDLSEDQDVYLLNPEMLTQRAGSGADALTQETAEADSGATSWLTADQDEEDEEDDDQDEEITLVLTSFEDLTGPELESAVDSTLDLSGEDESFVTPEVFGLDEIDTAPDVLTTEDLIPLIDESMLRWEESGLTDAQIEALKQIDYQIVELDGNYLASAEQFSITIDPDAAGREWFIDETPDRDEEFIAGPESETQLFTSSAPGYEVVATSVDLLSVIMHEQGHVLGLEDIYNSMNDSVMYGIFSEGERRLLTEGQADGAVAGSLEGVHYAITPGGIITGETATASSDFFGDQSWGRPIEAAVNDTGMTGEGATGLHAATSYSDGWQASQTTAPWIKVDLGATYDVENMYVWNGSPADANWGAQTVDIYYSTTDPGVNVNDSEAAFNTAGWEYWGTVADLAKHAGTNPYGPSDTIALGVNARYIVLNVTAAHGGINNTSIAELQFSGTETAQAAPIITGETATASSDFFGDQSWGRPIEAAVNDTGMTGEGAAGLHAATNYEHGWQTGQTTAPWIKVDLGATYDVENMYVWNGAPPNADWGAQTVDIYYSTTDPGVNVNDSEAAFNPADWTLWSSGVTFAKHAGTNPYGPSDTIALNETARYIALNVTAAYGGINNASIAELQFSGTENEVVVPNTAPTIDGTVASQAVDDNLTVSPFSGVTIDDDDGNSLTVTVTLDVAANGTLSGGGFSETGSGTGIYTYTAADPTAATTAIRALVFDPTENQVAPGSTVTTKFTISVDDGTADAVIDDTTTVIATSINDNPTAAPAPIITGVTATASSDLFSGGTSTSLMVDGTGMVSGEGAGGLHAHGSFDDDWRVGSVIPFPWVKFDLGASYDVGDMYVWNSLGSGLPDFAIREIDIYYATADPGNNVDLSTLAFDATDWTLWGTEADMAQIPGAADYGPTTTTALNVNARYIAFDIKKGWNTGDSPANSAIAEVQFSGVRSLTTTALDDNAGATNLFGDLEVADVDAGEDDLSLTITLGTASAGTITGGGFTETGTGVYTATGLTVAEANTALDNVQFTPTNNTGSSGTFTTDISVTVNDQGGGGEQTVLAATEVTITRINDAPVIGPATLVTTTTHDGIGSMTDATQWDNGLPTNANPGLVSATTNVWMGVAWQSFSVRQTGGEIFAAGSPGNFAMRGGAASTTDNTILEIDDASNTDFSTTNVTVSGQLTMWNQHGGTGSTGNTLNLLNGYANVGTLSTTGNAAADARINILNGKLDVGALVANRASSTVTMLAGGTGEFNIGDITSTATMNQMLVNFENGSLASLTIGSNGGATAQGYWETKIATGKVQINGVAVTDLEKFIITDSGATGTSISLNPVLKETNAPLTTSGTLTVTDVDTTDVVTSTRTLTVDGTSNRSDAAAPSDAELLAMLTLTPATPTLSGTESTATLNWSFDSGTETFDYLAEGETLILNYEVQATDDATTPVPNNNVAGIIPLTGASATAGDEDFWEATRVTDSSYMASGEGASGLMDGSQYGGWYGSDADTWFRVDLGASYEVGEMFVWNGQPGPGVEGRGVRAADIYYATSASATGASIPTNGESSEDWTFVGSYEFAAKAADTADYLPTTTINLGDLDVTARVIGFDFSKVTGGAWNQGGNSLGQLQFSGTLIPEPIDNSLNDTETVTITITGSNDAPELSAGEIIPLTGAASTAGDEDFWEATRVTDSSYMASGEGASGLMAGSQYGGWYGSDADTWFRVDLGASYEVGEMFVWNGQPGPGVEGRGVRAADIYYATSASATGASIPTNGESSEDWTFVGSYEFAAKAADTADYLPTTTINLGDLDVTARVIGFDFSKVTGGAWNQGGNSLGQLQFSGTLASETILTETNDPLTSSGTLNVEDVDTTDEVNMAVDSVGVVLSDGALPTGLTEEDLKGMLTFPLNPVIDDEATSATVDWTFNSTVAGEAFDFLAKDETLTLTYTVSATDDSGFDTAATPNEINKDTHEITITIHGTNDPVTANDDAAEIDESFGLEADLVNAPNNTASGNVIGSTHGTGTNTPFNQNGFMDVADTDIDTNDTLTVQDVVSDFTGGTAVSPGTTVVGQYGNLSIDAAGDYTYTLGVTTAQEDLLNDVNTGTDVTDDFTLTITDSQGDTDESKLAITVHGITDNVAPTITDDDLADQAVDDNATLALFSTGDGLIINDPDSDEDLAVVVTILNGANRGDFTPASTTGWTRGTSGNDITYTQTFSAAGAGAAATAATSGVQAFVFDPRENTIAPGTTEETTFTVQVTDDDSAVANSDAEISVITTSINDAPVIDTSTAANFVGAVTEDDSTPNLTDTGTLPFTDVDLTDAHTVAPTHVSTTGSAGVTIPSATSTALTTALATVVDDVSTGDGAGTIDWTFTLANSLTQFLGAGESITAVYDVTVIDDSAGAPATGPAMYTFTSAEGFSGSFSFDSSAGTPSDEGGGLFKYTAWTNSAPVDAVLPTFELNNPDYPTAVWNQDDEYFFLTITTDGVGGPPVLLEWDGDNTAGPDTGGFMAGNMHFVDGTGSVEQDAGPSIHSGFHEHEYTGVVLTEEAGAGTPVTGDNSDTEQVTITIHGTNDAPVITGPITRTALYEEHFVDTQGQSHPNWGTPGGHTGIQVANSDTGWAGYGGGDYGAVVSDQWGDTDPTPDGDDWHFFGFNDSNNAFLYTKPGEVNIAAADRVGTQFSADLAKTDDNGLRWLVQTGGNYYLTDVFFESPHGAVDGNGSVSDWDQVSLDVEAENIWYKWTDTDSNPFNGGWDLYNEDALTPYLGAAQTLPSGDITAAGFFVRKDDNGHRLAVDNFRITTAQPVPAEGAVTEDDSTGNLTDTGTLPFTDVDLTDAHTVAPAHVSTTGSAGVTIPTATSDALETALATVVNDVSTGDGAGTIDWTFTLANSLTQFLAAGETVTVVYDVTVTDDSGVTATNSDTEQVTVVITGTNDAPVIVDTVTVLNTGSKVVASSLSNSSSTLSFDAGATADKLIVTVSSEKSGGAYTVSYNGTALTLAVAHTGGSSADIWYLDSPFTGGAADLVVDFTGVGTVNGLGLGVVSISGSAPGVSLTDSAGSSDSVSTTLAAADANSFVVAATNTNGLHGTIAVDAPMKSIYASNNIGSARGAAGYQNGVDAGAQTFSFTVPDNQRATTVAVFNPDDSAVTDLGTITETADMGDTDADPTDATGTIIFYDVDLSDTHTAVILPGASVTGGSAQANLTDEQKTALLDNLLLGSVTDNTDGSGSVDWTYDVPNSEIDFLAEGETVEVTHTVQIADDSGSDTSTVVVTITGTNDAPVITSTPDPQVGGITESPDNVGGTDDDPDDATGTITFTDVDLSDTHTATILPGASVTGGSALANLTDDQKTALLDNLSLESVDDTPVGSGSVGWKYDVPNSEIDFLAAGETVEVTHTVAVSDGSPVIVGNTASNAETSGTFDDSITISNFTVEPGDDRKLVLTASWEQGATGISATWNGTEAFTVAVNSAGGRNSAILYLDDPSVGTGNIVVTFGGNTGSRVGVVSLTNAADGVAVTSTDTGVSGSLTTTQPNTLVVGAYTSNGNIGGSGTYSSPFSDPIYAGNSSSSHGISGYEIQAVAGAETYAWTDNFGAANNNALAGFVGVPATQDVVVTITGTNDAPTIDATDSATLVEDETDPTLTDGGTLNFGDVDLTDTHSVNAVTASPAVWSGGAILPAGLQAALDAAIGASIDDVSTGDGTGTIDWDFNLANADVQFLAAGETLTATYTVTVTDDDASMASADSTITVTITGTNDAPVIDTSTAANFVGAVTEDDSTPNLSDTGTLPFTDVDLTDAHSVAPAHVSTTPSAGVTIPTATSTALMTALATVVNDVSTGDGAGTIDWTFTLANGLTQFLAEGETITVVYGVTVTDDSGVTATNSDTEQVTITITGTNDVPTVTLTGNPINENEIATVTGTIDDPDLTDKHTVVIDWDDANNPVDSSFTLDPTGSLFGKIFTSTDGAVLTVTSSAAQLESGIILYEVTGHQYLDDGPSGGNGTPSDISTVQITVEDSESTSGSNTPGFELKVSNVDPVLGNVTANPTVVNENGTVTVSGNVMDVGTLDVLTLTIAWGDGKPDTVVTLAPGVTSFSENHVYDSGGTFPVTVTLLDDDGGSDTTTLVVGVTDVPPSLDLNPIPDVTVGETSFLSGSFTDPGLVSDHTITVDWGDGTSSEFDLGSTNDLSVGDTFSSGGSTLTITGIDLATGEVEFSIQHDYAVDGIYNVKLSVNDGNFTVAQELTATVFLIAPTDTTPGFFTNQPGANNLMGISGIFRDMTDFRLFVGFRADDGEDDRLLEGFMDEEGTPDFLRDLTLAPFFAGKSTAGASVVVMVKDDVGIVVAQTTVIADMAGNWAVTFPQLELDEGDFTVEIQASDIGTIGGDLETQIATFSGGLLGAVESMSGLSAGQIVGVIVESMTLDEALSGN